MREETRSSLRHLRSLSQGEQDLRGMREETRSSLRHLRSLSQGEKDLRGMRGQAAVYRTSLTTTSLLFRYGLCLRSFLCLKDARADEPSPQKKGARNPG